MVTDEQIDKLDELQSVECDGRGVTHIKTIVHFLRKGEVELAKNTYRIEGDKTRAYPKIEDYLRELFGCRSHFNKDCDHWLCKMVDSD